MHCLGQILTLVESIRNNRNLDRTSTQDLSGRNVEWYSSAHNVAYIKHPDLPKARFAGIHGDEAFIAAPSRVQIAFHIAVARTGAVSEYVYVLALRSLSVIQNEGQ